MRWSGRRGCEYSRDRETLWGSLFDQRTRSGRSMASATSRGLCGHRGALDRDRHTAGAGSGVTFGFGGELGALVDQCPTEWVSGAARGEAGYDDCGEKFDAVGADLRGQASRFGDSAS